MLCYHCNLEILDRNSAINMWLKVCVLALCSIYSARSVEITPFKAIFSVAEGSRFEVNCSSQRSVSWSSDPANAMPDNNKGQVAGSDNVSTLLMENVQKSNEGRYRCSDGQSDASFQLRVFTVRLEDDYFKYKEDAMLHCNVDDVTRTYSYSWTKGDTAVEDIEVDERQKFVTHDNGSLEIVHPPRSFAGMYTCHAEYEENGKVEVIKIDVPFYASPKVIPFDKSKNLVQEEPMLVECRVLGYPKPSITWFKENERIQAGPGSRYTLSPADTYDGMMIDDARLEIKSVDFGDAASYKCIASHPNFPDNNSTQVLLVRVKDKLAALWPFLGILVEVGILCAIIFFYEKRRSKQAAEEAVVPDEASSDKKAEGVRHRGNANPRA